MSSIPCDIVLLPNPLLADSAIAASQKLEQFDSYFTLEDGKYYPHISLYMFQLNVKDVSQIEDQLVTLAQSFAPLKLQAYRYDHAQCFVDAEYEKFPELTSLQDEVIKAANPIREGMRKKDMERMKEAEGIALQNYKEYGYKSVGELFRPHMTLSRLKAENPEASNVLGDVDQFSGAFTKIGLFEMGDNGTAIRKLKEFELLPAS